MSIFTSLCERQGISREDASYADINVIKTLFTSNLDFNTVVKNSIEIGKQKFKLSQNITLAPIIKYPEEVYSFSINDNLLII